MPTWAWSKTANNNASADPTINFAEGQSPSSVNDSARALMAAIADNRDDTNGTITAGGTNVALTFTSNSGIAATPQDGQRLTFRMPFANGVAPTLTVDGGNTYPLQSAAGVAVGTGIMVNGGVYDVSFSVAATAWIVVAAFIGNVQGPATAVAGDLAGFADTTGKVLKDLGPPGPLALQQSILQANLAPDAAPLPFIAPQVPDNLLIANDVSNPTRDVDISPGRVRDDVDFTNMRLVSIMVKRLDTSFAPGGLLGSPQGGCDAGSKGASQTWHAYLIGRVGLIATTGAQYARSGTTITLTTSANHGLGVGGTARVIGINVSGAAQGFDGNWTITGTTPTTLTYTSNVSGTVATKGVPAGTTLDGFDVLFSQSYPTPTLPSGWNVKQCLGSILTDGSSNIRAFTQIGDYFTWNTPPTDISAVASPNSNFPLSVPNGIIVETIFNATLAVPTGAATNCYIYQPGTTQPGIAIMTISNSTGTNLVQGIYGRSLTNAAKQITVVGIGGTLSMSTIGWRDPRRRMF